jgi:hypothetical protein
MRLEDRLEDNSISRTSSSLYYACTVRVAAILEDMADFLRTEYCIGITVFVLCVVLVQSNIKKRWKTEKM